MIFRLPSTFFSITANTSFNQSFHNRTAGYFGVGWTDDDWHISLRQNGNRSAQVHRAAHTPGQPIKPIPLLGAVLVVAGAASCGAWGETMSQLALTQLGELDGPEEI